jgi:tetratricopeptide (TPR) repeat protein
MHGRMIMHLKRYIVFASCFLTVGCAAMGVPETNDPHEKLRWAIELLDRQMRPLPAERLINEAILICTKNNDRDCLAHAYLTYGFFFCSPSLVKWQKVYQKNGFQDKTASYETRFIKSKEYFEKSIPIFDELGQFDALTNAYLNLGFVYEHLDNKAGACESYTKSLENYRKNIERNPSADVALPTGFTNYADYLSVQQKRIGCIK